MLTAKDYQGLFDRIKTVKDAIQNELDDYKTTSAYIDMICPNSHFKKIENSPIKKMEKLVSSIILKEFGRDFKRTKSYEVLLNTVMYKLQKESLGEISEK